MTGKTDQILELLFGTRRLEEVPVSDLKDLLEEFPSFNAAHYFLSKKLKLESSEEYSSETQKTALYFTNPFWLQWLLETPEQDIDSDSATAEKSNESIESPVDIVGSESSIWSDHQATLQEESFFEESIIQEKEPLHEPIGEMNLEEIHLTENYLSSFERDPEPETIIENSNDVLKKEFEEVSETSTESINESLSNNAHTNNEIPQAFETESSGEIIFNKETEQGLNFHEPDDFREEPIQEIQQEETIATTGFVTNPEVFDESPAAEPQETAPLPEHPVQEEKHSRSPFFWEKEFPAKESEPVNEPIQEEPVTIAQIPELLKPYQDNPAFLLAENESLVPDEGVKVQAEVHVDPAMQDLEKEGNEARVFFDHNPSIWEPAPMQVEEAIASKVEDPVILSSVQDAPIVEEKITSEETSVLPIESSHHSSHELKTESSTVIADTSGDELQFTPYHTVDYFASQGIRFIQEENPTDKFGKQLKSFTAWLKIMKRLPKTLMETDMSAMTEAAIHDIAEHSIEEKEVITEAMAQVLALQGQNGRAIELYEKLSLLNPSKSAYFAARIEQIKSDLT